MTANINFLINSHKIDVVPEQKRVQCSMLCKM